MERISFCQREPVSRAPDVSKRMPATTIHTWPWWEWIVTHLPGPGRRITVYANAGHAFMVVDGRRYDTSALSGGGTRWTSEMRSTAGFVARHPPGL